METMTKSPTATSVSNEDAEVLIVWTYLEVKLGKYSTEFANTEDASNADEDADRNTVVERLANLVKIAHTLPTNAKYAPLTDALKMALHQRIDLDVKGEGLQPLDEATQSAVLESMKKFAPDINYIFTKVSQEKRNRILNRYYGTI
jgi:hypothetical protein